MELSKRLNAVAAMVTSGNTVCDVGCDHGYVSIFLIKTGKCPKAYALDVRKGPLERAKEHVKVYECTDYIELKLSDGLSAMSAGAADTLICAGMGGRLVVKILSEGMEKVRAMKELILQPQSEIGLVRKFIRQAGFALAEEDMIEEDGKYYPVMRIIVPVGQDQAGWPPAQGMERAFGEEAYRTKEVRTTEEKQDVLDTYGPILLSERHPVLKEYLLRQEALLEQIQKRLEESGGNGEQTKQRKRELEQEKRQVKAALAYYDEAVWPQAAAGRISDRENLRRKQRGNEDAVQ